MRLEWYSGCEAVLALTDDTMTSGGRFYAVRTAVRDPQPEFSSLPGIKVILFDSPTTSAVRLEPVHGQRR